MHHEEQACGSDPHFATRSVGSKIPKMTEMGGILQLATGNKNKVYEIAQRLSHYLERQVGIMPTDGNTGDPEVDRGGNIFEIRSTLNREAEALTDLEKIVSHLEEIG